VKKSHMSLAGHALVELGWSVELCLANRMLTAVSWYAFLSAVVGDREMNGQ